MKIAIKPQPYISLVCYSLIGKAVDKIQPTALDMLCKRVVEYYAKESKTKIIYNQKSLLEFVQTFSTKNNYKQIQIFKSSLDAENNLVFMEDSYVLLANLSKLFAIIPYNEFVKLYPFINDFINMYQLIEFINLNPQKY